MKQHFDGSNTASAIDVTVQIPSATVQKMYPIHDLSDMESLVDFFQEDYG
jgi:hypothetical protein